MPQAQEAHPLPALYTAFAGWWPLLSAPADYEEEAAVYTELLCALTQGETRTVLELGSGGGNNAGFMQDHFRMTLCDLSPEMLAVSRKRNPACEHIQGDMRTLRLRRQFDAVFIHDAIIYMCTEADLRRALETAYCHCRPGGAVLLVPDYTEESFAPATHHGGCDGEQGAMRYLQWDHDPVPGDGQYHVNLAYVLEQPDGVLPTISGETHVCGLFSQADWFRWIREAGFIEGEVVVQAEDGEGAGLQMFSGRKPTGAETARD